MKYIYLALIIANALLPELAFASGITEFSSPVEKVVGTLTGPVGRFIAIFSMGLCGVTYVFGKNDMSEGFKLLLAVVFGISFIAFAPNIINVLFSFSGAVI